MIIARQKKRKKHFFPFSQGGAKYILFFMWFLCKFITENIEVVIQKFKKGY